MLACSETSHSLLPGTWGLKRLGRVWIIADNFWLSEAQWATIPPYLPMVHTGPVRQDDRRIISGILHRLREGCRWRALPAEYGPHTIRAAHDGTTDGVSAGLPSRRR
jgi:transposase